MKYGGRHNIFENGRRPTALENWRWPTFFENEWQHQSFENRGQPQSFENWGQPQFFLSNGRQSPYSCQWKTTSKIKAKQKMQPKTNKIWFCDMQLYSDAILTNKQHRHFSRLPDQKRTQINLNWLWHNSKLT